VYVLPCGTLRSELLVALRQARKALRPWARGTDRRGQILNMTSIAECLAEVATRTVPSHWGDDLIKGARNGSAVGIMVARTTRLVILVRMTRTDVRSAREGFTKKLRHVSVLLRKPLTYDQGKEMAEHERLAIREFFADPYSPWQRGTNENMNGLLRQYRAEGHGLVGLHAARIECHCPSAEHAPTNMFGLCHAPGSLCAISPSFTRCTCNLKPPTIQNRRRKSG
jgi:IS30 family transposase